MTLDKLIEEAQNFKITEAYLAAIEFRLNQAELQFQKEAEHKRMTEQHLNYEYTL